MICCIKQKRHLTNSSISLRNEICWRQFPTFIFKIFTVVERKWRIVNCWTVLVKAAGRLGSFRALLIQSLLIRRIEQKKETLNIWRVNKRKRSKERERWPFFLFRSEANCSILHPVCKRDVYSLAPLQQPLQLN